eukprot:357715-Chlamydomonas_euryale.AAC.16
MCFGARADPSNRCFQGPPAAEEKGGCTNDAVPVRWPYCWHTAVNVQRPTVAVATACHRVTIKYSTMSYRCHRQILKEIIDKKEGMGDIMKASFFAMTEAVYSAGSGIKYTIKDNVSYGISPAPEAQLAVRARREHDSLPNLTASHADHAAVVGGDCVRESERRHG